MMMTFSSEEEDEEDEEGEENGSFVLHFVALWLFST